MIKLVLIWAVGCLVFFGLPYLALKASKFGFRLSKREVIVMLSVVLVVCGLAISISGRSDTVYVWDNGNYWRAALGQEESVRENPLFDSVKNTLNSLRMDDYNAVIPTLVSVPLMVLGRSYGAFIITVLVMFVVPAAYMLAKLMERLLKKKKGFVWFFLAAMFVLPVMYPAFIGYFDAALLVPVVALLYVVLNMNVRKFEPKACLWVAVLCLMIFTIRRYFAFFIVGFVVAWLAKTIAEWVRNREHRKEIFMAYLKSMLMIGGICGAILLVIFMPLIERMLVNYSDVYSAWQHGDFWYNTWRMLTHFGLLPVALAIVGIVFLIRKYLGVGVFFLTSMLVSFVLFVRTQSMDSHHMYILTAQMVVLVGVGLAFVVEVLEKKLTIKIARSIAVGIGAMCFLFMLVPVRTPLFSNKKIVPEVRDDMLALGSIVANIESNPDDKYYVLASSFILNSDTLRKYNMPRDLKGPQNLLVTADADLRDGWPAEFLDADVVLVADPVQLHLSGGQKIIEIPAEEILSGAGIGESYVLEEEYAIKDGVTVKSYRRVKEVDENERIHFAKIFDELYPGRESLFRDRLLNEE